MGTFYSDSLVLHLADSASIQFTLTLTLNLSSALDSLTVQQW